MSIKDIKFEARQKLPVNMHQAIVVYTIEYVILATLIALIAVSCVLFNAINNVAVVVAICFGVALFILALVMSGIVNYSLVDFYLASYRCKPYNVRRLVDTVARNGIVKILALNTIRTLLGVLLTALLIVPGVFYLSRTSMANHLLNANPKMKPSTALSASGKVMSGKLGNYLALHFSMFGWYVLGVATLGIGFIFIKPYLNLVKTIYYKRNLQGDKTVYKIPVQPVSPIPEQPEVLQPEPQPIARTVYKAPADETARPIVIDNPIPPIATMNENDVRDLNAAITDFGGEAVQVQDSAPVNATATHTVNSSADVPEVPLTPPVTGLGKKNGTARSSDTAAQAPLITGDSDIVETVRPLSTREVDESRVFDRRVDELYSNSNPRSDEKPRNYFGETSPQKPDDFVTSEFHGDAAHTSTAANAGQAPTASSAAAQPTASEGTPEPVMSDAEFAEFLRNFDAPVTDQQFTPLSRRDTAKPDEPSVTPSEPFAASAAAGSPYESASSAHSGSDHFGSSRDSAEPPPTTRNRPSRPTMQHTDRAHLDRARFEREARLRNLRNK